MVYELYPAIDESYSFPQVVRQALSESLELRNSVVPMTTVQRNSLTIDKLWDGRVIANTTEDRLQRYDAGTSQWKNLVEAEDLPVIPEIPPAPVDHTTHRAEFGRDFNWAAPANLVSNIPLTKTVFNSDTSSFSLVSDRVRCGRAGRIIVTSLVAATQADAVMREVKTGIRLNSNLHWGSSSFTSNTSRDANLNTVKTYVVSVGDLLSPVIYPFDAASTAGSEAGAFGWFQVDYI